MTAGDGGAAGGAGTANSITGASVTYSKGGDSASGSAGPANTGQGGATATGGGSGFVAIKYADEFSEISAISVGLTYTFTVSGGFKIYQFTAGTGTVTF